MSEVSGTLSALNDAPVGFLSRMHTAAPCSPLGTAEVTASAW